MTETYAILYRPGSKWIEGQPLAEQPLKEHSSYLLRQATNGPVKMGGPFSDGSGGLVIVEVSGPEQARRLVDHDPAIVNQILAAEVHKWDRIV